jgi:hypothetical protein
MSGSGLELRRAADSDLRAAYDVFAAAEGELWRRHALSWSPPPFDACSATQRHLLAEDGERSFVAVDGERLVGSVRRWSVATRGSCRGSSFHLSTTADGSAANCSTARGPATTDAG